MNYLALTFAFLGLFNYPSAEQAKSACYDWLSEGRTFTYEDIQPGHWLGNGGKQERGCKLESSTNQYLGIEYPDVIALPDNPTISQLENASYRYQVVKHFRF